MCLFCYGLGSPWYEFLKKRKTVFLLVVLTSNTYGVSRRLPTMLQSRSGKPVSQCTNKSYQDFISSLQRLRSLSFSPPATNQKQCLKIKNTLSKSNSQMREAIHMMHQFKEDTWELKSLKKKPSPSSSERIKSLRKNLQRARQNNIFDQSFKKTEQFFKVFGQALKWKCFGAQNSATLQRVLLSFSGMLDLFTPQDATGALPSKNRRSVQSQKSLYAYTSLSRALFDFDINNYQISGKNPSLKKALTCSLKKVATECEKSEPSPASHSVCIDCLEQDFKPAEDQKIRTLRKLASLNPCQTHQQFFSRLKNQLKTGYLSPGGG